MAQRGTRGVLRLSTGNLPSLGDWINRRVGLRSFKISPVDRTYRAWETFLVLLAIYTAWVSPFEFGFLKRAKGPIAIANSVVNGFFAVDIVLTFFVAYFDRATYILIYNPKQIAWKYTRSWLAFDVISTIPSEVIWMIFRPSGKIFDFFNMLRLLRLRRVTSLFSRLEKDRNFNYCGVRSAKIICVTLFVVHCTGCFYYLRAAHYHDLKRRWFGASIDNFLDQSLWIQYVTMIYWSITTLTSVDYGDLHPQNTREMIFDIFYVFFQYGLAAYLIGNMTTLVVHGTIQTGKFRDTIQHASSFAQRNQLPLHLQNQMLQHIYLKFRTNTEGQILDALPKAIRSTILHSAFNSLVEKVYLFHGVSKEFLFQLVSEMKAEDFAPDVNVMAQNERPTDFYVVVSGAVDLLARTNGTEKVVGEAKSGDLCGEIGLLCSRAQLFTVRTKQLSQLLRLNRTAFLDVIQANAGDGPIIMNNFVQHLKEAADPLMEGVLTETEKMLARGRMELPLCLCFNLCSATMGGYDQLLHQLLKRGLDPNESDNSGRTALHIAASKGSEKCVLLILQFGADPNSRDLEGNVPLWEAILGMHEPVIELLIENGANISSGDVGHFACTAAEQNSLGLLQDIVINGGDVTLPKISNGNTALHVAVRQQNTEIVKFLLEQGAEVDMPDFNGWTARGLADLQGNEEIKVLFQSKQETKSQSVLTTSEPMYCSSFLGPTSFDPWGNSRLRRRANHLPTDNASKTSSI